MQKYTFTTIGITGYRRLSVIALEMRPLTVMIGANGVGKTSFLEVFDLLAASAKGELRNKLSKLGGFQSVLTCDDKTENISFRIAMDVVDHEPLNYSLNLAGVSTSYEITYEELSQRHSDHQKPFNYINSNGSDVKYFPPGGKKLLRPNWDYSFSETALSQIPKMYKEPEQMRNRLASCTYYSAYNLDLSYQSPIRLPQAMQPATHPGSKGEDLVSCLYYLRETDRPRFEVIEDTLKVAFQSFKRLNFPPVAAGTLTMTWEDEKFSKPLYMNQLSEGMLRFLWLITLLYSPNLTAVTLLDEPEVSLHPELLNLLRDAMREAAKSTHLIVATHSDRLIGFLQPKEVLILDSDEEGLTKMTWADSDEFDLETWLTDYSLDELWRMGQIGGRA